MDQPLQKIIVIVLVMLQLAAPLVHAHSVAEIAGLGVHVPGLEGWTIGSTTNGISSIEHQPQKHNYLVSVSSAIQQKLPATIDHPSVDELFTLPVFAFSIAFLGCIINFSPHADQLLNPPSFSPHSPRAPPLSL